MRLAPAMKLWGAALAALLAVLALAAPAGAASRKQVQAAAFDVPMPAAPIRDLVIERPTKAAARVLARGSLQRNPVNDGAGRSVEITVSPFCDPLVSCQDADPQTIANFLGTIAHGDEMNLLNVDLQPGAELASTCGSAAAQACYFPSLNLMIINGNDTTASDGATRDFVIAHEYGHHLANHRINPPFDSPAVDWGPKRWASYERVCEGVAAGTLFPGNEGSRYFQNPGEAFAEAFAFARFPTAPVAWHWIESLRPDANSLAAARGDALDPWTGPSTVKRQGRFPKRKRPKRKAKNFGTALDGDLTVKLNGKAGADLALILRGANGRELEQSDGIGSKEAVSYRICGEGSVSATVRRQIRQRTRFFLSGQIP